MRPEPTPDQLPMTNSGNGEMELSARSRLISPSLLVSGEAVVFEIKPSRWYVALLSWPFVLVGVAMVMVGLFVRQLDAYQVYVVQFGICLAGARLVVALLQWMGRTYVLTDRRVLKQYGVINVRVEVLGLEEIKNTFVAQSALQRCMGIGTVFFRPEGRSEAHAWEHVSNPREVHGHIVMQIDRWQRHQERMGGPRKS